MKEFKEQMKHRVAENMAIIKATSGIINPDPLALINGASAQTL